MFIHVGVTLCRDSDDLRISLTASSGGSPTENGRDVRKWRDISSISTLGLNAFDDPSLGHGPLNVIYQHQGKTQPTLFIS